MTNFNLLSIDFDYWYLGLNVNNEYHCGRCQKRTKRPIKPDLRFSPPEIMIEDVVSIIRPGLPIYMSESHADIVILLKELKNQFFQTRVYNIDAHSDKTCLTENMELYCGNWVTYSKNANILGQYKHITKMEEFRYLPTIDLVYVCKSSPYLLEVGDKPFVTFVQSLEEVSETVAKPIGYSIVE